MTENKWNHIICADCDKRYRCRFDESKPHEESCNNGCKIGTVQHCYCKKCTKKRFPTTDFSSCVYSEEKEQVNFT